MGCTLHLPLHNFILFICLVAAGFAFFQQRTRNQPIPVDERSAADPLRGLRVRISPASWMSRVNTVCCQAEVSATGWFLVQRSTRECMCVCVCVCVCVVIICNSDPLHIQWVGRRDQTKKERTNHASKAYLNCHSVNLQTT